MQSEQEYIDDFFRKKEAEYQYDTGDAGMQWERMRSLMAPPAQPTPKAFRLLSSRRVIRYVGGFAIVTIVSLISITTIRPHKKAAAPRAKAVAATTAPQPLPATTTRVVPAEKAAAPASTSKSTSSSAAGSSSRLSSPSGGTLVASRQTGGKATGNAHKTSVSPMRNNGSALVRHQSSPTTDPPANQSFAAHITADQQTPGTSKDRLTLGKEQAAGNDPGNLVVTNPGATAVATPGVAAAQINAFYKTMAKPANVFTVDVEQETVLNGREGTKLIIPPHTFATSSGILKNQLVTLVLEEYYRYEDMLAAKLTTTSGEDQLISNGMVRLTAHSNGKPVNIAYRKSIQLEMPAPRFDPEMQLFRGTRSSLKDGYRAAFVENRMIDTVHFKKLEADENGDIDWIPEGQLQSARKTNLLDRNIIVFNPYGDPFKVTHGRRKTKAYIYLSKNCPLSKRQMEKLIIEHSNYYYDKVRFIRFTTAPGTYYRYKEEGASIAGDSILMTFRQALRKKLLSPADSASVLQRLRADSANLAGLPETSNKYRFTINSLGYFNCDKYNRQPASTPNVLFAFNPGDGFERSSMVTHLVFTRYKSVIKGTFKADKINFGRIPQNEPVKVLCLGVKNGKIMACIQNLNTSKNEIANLTFAETTPEQFRQQLQELSIALP